MNLYLELGDYNPESMPGKGPSDAKYMFVGIAPSPNRPKARRNEPFGARSWQMLRRILEGAPPGGVYLTNLVKQEMPSGKRIPIRFIRQNLPVLGREIRFIRPYRILALGTEPAQALCPGFQEMREDHGVLFKNDLLSQLVGHTVTVVPTYHFSAIGRDPLKIPILARDLQRFFELPDAEPPKYQVMRKKVPEFRPGARVYLDIENERTANFNPKQGELTSIGIGVDYSDTVLMYERPSREMLRDLHDKLKKADATLVGQNFQYDLYWLTEKSGLLWDFPVEDTMLLAHNQGEEIVGLKHMTTMLTDQPGPHAFGTFEDLGYAASDIHATRAVSIALREKREPQHVDKMMWRAIPELVAMRHRGVFIDRPLLSQLAKDYEKEIKKQEIKLVEEWGQAALQVNWKANAEVVDLFQANNIRLTERTDSGALTTKESVLLELAKDYPKVQTLLDYRGVLKTLTGFFQGYLALTTDEHPYLHPFQDLKGAITGRTSMKDPNLQQVTRVGPSKLIFKPRWEGGKFGLIDLQQAELRAACLISDDEVMASAILSGDPHRFAAAIAFRKTQEQVSAAERKKVKGVVFGKLYGGSSQGLAIRIGVGVDEVEAVDRAVFGTFKKLAEWLKWIKRFGVDNLYVEDVFGRRRDLRALMQNEGPGSVGRKACNTPIQALASHMAMTILSETSINLRTRGLKTRTLYGIHDSTLLEIHPDDPMDEIHQCIQDAFYSLNYTPLSNLPMWERLPIQGELVIGKHWAAVESTSDYYDPDNNLTFQCNTRIAPIEVMNKLVQEFSLT